MRSVCTVSSALFLTAFSSPGFSFPLPLLPLLRMKLRERQKPSLSFLGLSLFALGLVCELSGQYGNVMACDRAVRV
jgi:hypothetical protein